MKKITVITMLVFAILSCKNGSDLSHEKMIEHIDNLGLSEKIYEVEINWSGEKGDTVSIKSIKRDEDGKKVYEKLVSYKSGWQNEVYFNDNEDEFFRKSKNSSNVITSQKHFFINDTLRQKTRIIITEDGEVDTSIINYDYAYLPNGKVRQMKFVLGEDSDSSLYVTYFNEAGKRSGGLQIENSDTSFQFESIFENGSLFKTTNKFRKRVQTDYFDENENRVRSEVFMLRGDSLVLSRALDYSYDEDGNMLSQTISQPDWDWTERIEYVKVDME